MIPLYKTYSDQADIDAVSEVIRSGMHWAEGPKVAEFEQRLAEYMGVKYAICVNSGTSALHLALLSCGIGQGDEVIVPSFTFIATANAVLMTGARPVFADIEESTFGLEPQDVDTKITKDTRAILTVHYAGCACRINALKAIAVKHHILLLEDAAESMGADVGGEKVGSFGNPSILSFCANKIISTGEGGAVVTNSEEMANKVRLLRSHGRSGGNVATGEPAEYVSLGYNFRMSDMQAALGISQLKKIEWLIERRQQIAVQYSERLHPLGAISANAVYQLFTIRVPADKRDYLQAYLASQGITSKVYFPPVHQTPFYRSLGYKDHLPVTEKVSSEVLSLPMYPGLTEGEIEYICENVRKGLCS